MNSILKYFRYSLMLMAAFLLIQCEKNETEKTDDPIIVLSSAESAGHAQYKESIESGYDIVVQVNVNSTGSLTLLQVTKTVNLVVDPTFGNNGVETIFSSSTGSSYEYTFTYSPTVNDVDQLVGFTFKAENDKGSSSESDLTLVVTLSPRDNLTRRQWNLVSVLHVNNEDTPNLESINDCEKDNYMLLNADGTMSIEYGEDTGSGSCLFDGFNVYTGWELTDDDQYFIRTSYGIFTPNTIVIDTFVVQTLTVEEFAIEQTVDLSVFGMRADEKFLYIYEAAPRTD